MKIQIQYTTLYRIVHWLIAIGFLFLLITIFLRLTWLNKNNVAEVINDYLLSLNIELSKEQLIVLAKKIRQPMWNWHIYIGYFLTAMFSFRFVMPLFNKLSFQNPFNKGLSIKEKFQKGTYLVFYVCVSISLVTGLIIELGPGTIKKTMESIHVLSLYYLIPFVILHFGGVLMAEFTVQKGIISDIISGKKPK